MTMCEACEMEGSPCEAFVDDVADRVVGQFTDDVTTIPDWVFELPDDPPEALANGEINQWFSPVVVRKVLENATDEETADELIRVMERLRDGGSDGGDDDV